jgi:hypothetical protein
VQCANSKTKLPSWNCDLNSFLSNARAYLDIMMRRLVTLKAERDRSLNERESAA